MNNHVHVIEDEEDIALLMQYNLRLEGLYVTCSSTGEEGLSYVEKNRPDIILLDLMLPGIDGLEICRRIRMDDELKLIPIIMVTAKGEERDIIKGLELGADDYISKPFGPQVLVARVKAVLRRYQNGEKGLEEILEFGDLKVHPGKHEVHVGPQKIGLTSSEYKILHLLARRPGWVYTRTQIVDAIRGKNYAVTDRTIDFQIVGLRKKLGLSGGLVETVRGVGYRFQEQL